MNTYQAGSVVSRAVRTLRPAPAAGRRRAARTPRCSWQVVTAEMRQVVAAQLDLKALAAPARGKKAAIADVAAAERAAGYVAGGISPLGQRRLRMVIAPQRWSSRRSTAAAAGAVWRSSWRRATWSGPRTRRWRRSPASRRDQRGSRRTRGNLTRPDEFGSRRSS